MKIKIQSKIGHKIINLNRRKAIKEKCLNCSGWSYKKVQNCQFTECQLYPYRTGMGKQNPKARAQAIREYCLSCTNGQRSEVKKCPCTDCPLFPYRQSRVDRSVAIIDSEPKIERIKRRKRTDRSQSIPKYRPRASVKIR
jgi:hypothetical protein